HENNLLALPQKAIERCNRHHRLAHTAFTTANLIDPTSAITFFHDRGPLFLSQISSESLRGTNAERRSTVTGVTSWFVTASTFFGRTSLPVAEFGVFFSSTPSVSRT